MTEETVVEQTTEEQIKAARELIDKARLERHNAAKQKIEAICQEHGVILQGLIIVPSNGNALPIKMNIGGADVQAIVQIIDAPKVDG